MSTAGVGQYEPDQAALDARWVQPWSEAFRAQRDVGLRVPINFITVPAVAVRAACFADNQFEHSAFQKCFSNLLAVGFQRFVVDVYWDVLRSEWSLCPVQQPRSATQQDDVVIVSGPSLAASSRTGATVARQTTVPLLGQSVGVGARQAVSTAVPGSVSFSSVVTSAGNVSATAGSSPTGTSVSQSAKPTVTSFATAHGPPLMQIGNYNCTTLTTLELLAGILNNHLDATATTTDAFLIYLTLNVHAAASISRPNAPAANVSQEQLPETGNLLSDMLKGNLSDNSYPPSNLNDDRANLNSSWYSVDWANRPSLGYFATTKTTQNILQTQDGWPNEAYMEFHRLLRLVTSFGTIDPQMSLYNTKSDTLFTSGSTQILKDTSYASSGRITSGCLFNPSEPSITTQTNSSWALSIPPASSLVNLNLTTSSPFLTNLTSCGLSPLLNTSLNTSAATNPVPYAAFARATLWSWAPGEPLNGTNSTSPLSTSAKATANRCAIISLSPHPGRWRTSDCAEKRRAACRDSTAPYRWSISTDTADYTNAATLCTPPSSFAVPRTALENSHLLHAIQESSSSSAANVEEPIYIDLSSLHTPHCWVSGANNSCPYLSVADTDRTRIVVVPTVAAIIVFVLAALTFFVKCAANRREGRRGRRRGEARWEGGWEYEGVPS